MEIRIRATGAVVFENEFRAMHANTSFPNVLTAELLDSMGADPVFEGPQASGGTVYQYSQRQGVEQVNGNWHTKYVLGPVFTDNADATAAEQEAAYKAAKDAEQAKSVRGQRNAKLAESAHQVLHRHGERIADREALQLRVDTLRSTWRLQPLRLGDQIGHGAGAVPLPAGLAAPDKADLPDTMFTA